MIEAVLIVLSGLVFLGIFELGSYYGKENKRDYIVLGIVLALIYYFGMMILIKLGVI